MSFQRDPVLDVMMSTSPHLLVRSPVFCENRSGNVIPRRARWSLAGVLCGLAFWSGLAFAQTERTPVTPRATPPRGTVLIRVDGQSITQGDLDNRFLSRRVADDLRPKVRAEFLDQMIGERLMRRFLASQKITINADEVEEQAQQLIGLLSKEQQQKLDLTTFGYTEKTLREELTLPLLWRNYLSKTVTDADCVARFEAHRNRYDGTQYRARQIFLKVPTAKPAAELDQARQQLATIRNQIAAGKITFEAAAKQYSHSPSKAQGGDLGFFTLNDGKLPKLLSQAAFKLQVDELSPILESSLGLHLLQVTEITPGELSLEDARPQVLRDISGELWQAKIAELRTTAKIERLVD